MKTKTLIPLLASLCLAANLPAQDKDAYREITAPNTPPAATAKTVRSVTRAGKNTSTARVSFSDTSKPGILKVNVPGGEIEIKGTGGGEVVVASTLDKKGAPAVDADGFRRLDHELSFELVEKDNVVTLSLAGGDPLLSRNTGAEFKIQVPRNTSLVIKTRSDGDVEIDNIDGDIEVSTLNGEIEMENVSGSVVASTTRGKIELDYKRPPTKPVSLSASNGDITLAVPPKTAANLRMHTTNGSIRTNFPEDAIKIVPYFAATGTTAIRSGADAERLASIRAEVARRRAEREGAQPPAAAPASVSPSEQSDEELIEAIVETRKEQALGYADKGLAAAQKGMAAAVQAIDNIPNLSAEEKELIKRKIQARANTIPSTVRSTSASTARGKRVTGELNGGGVNIRLTTMNGSITLKQEK